MRETKAALIVGFYQKGWPRKDIAEAVGCSRHYVIAAINRFKAGGYREADLRCESRRGNHLKTKRQTVLRKMMEEAANA